MPVRLRGVPPPCGTPLTGVGLATLGEDVRPNASMAGNLLAADWRHGYRMPRRTRPQDTRLAERTGSRTHSRSSTGISFVWRTLRRNAKRDLLSRLQAIIAHDHEHSLGALLRLCTFLQSDTHRILKATSIGLLKSSRERPLDHVRLEQLEVVLGTANPEDPLPKTATWIEVGARWADLQRTSHLPGVAKRQLLGLLDTRLDRDSTAAETHCLARQRELQATAGVILNQLDLDVVLLFDRLLVRRRLDELQFGTGGELANQSNFLVHRLAVFRSQANVARLETKKWIDIRSHLQLRARRLGIVGFDRYNFAILPVTAGGIELDLNIRRATRWDLFALESRNGAAARGANIIQC